jgi:hypothetical protein
VRCDALALCDRDALEPELSAAHFSKSLARILRRGLFVRADAEHVIPVDRDDNARDLRHG